MKHTYYILRNVIFLACIMFKVSQISKHELYNSMKQISFNDYEDKIQFYSYIIIIYK